MRSAALVTLLVIVGGCSGPLTLPEDSGLELSDLSGIWANPAVTLRINDAGDFIIQPAGSADQVLMGGFVARDGHRVVFVTGVGGECPGTRGVYAATVASGGLELDVAEDPCDLRVEWFDQPFAAAEG